MKSIILLILFLSFNSCYTSVKHIKHFYRNSFFYDSTQKHIVEIVYDDHNKNNRMVYTTKYVYSQNYVLRFLQDYSEIDSFVLKNNLIVEWYTYMDRNIFPDAPQTSTPGIFNYDSLQYGIVLLTNGNSTMRRRMQYDSNGCLINDLRVEYKGLEWDTVYDYHYRPDKRFKNLYLHTDKPFPYSIFSDEGVFLFDETYEYPTAYYSFELSGNEDAPSLQSKLPVRQGYRVGSEIEYYEDVKQQTTKKTNPQSLQK